MFSYNPIGIGPSKINVVCERLAQVTYRDKNVLHGPKCTRYFNGQHYLLISGWKLVGIISHGMDSSLAQ